MINIHIIEGFNPRPGDGLSHLRHGVNRVDKMTPIAALFSYYWRKTQAEAQDNAMAELRSDTHTCLPAENQFNMASHGVERTWRMPVEAHTEKCTERSDSGIKLLLSYKMSILW